MFPPSRETGLCGRGPGPRGAVPLPHHHSAALLPEAPGGAPGTGDQTPGNGAPQRSPTFQAAPSSKMKDLLSFNNLIQSNCFSSYSPIVFLFILNPG